MKRIALAAAAIALLGTGCIIHDDDTYVPPPTYGDAALYWQFRDLDGYVAGDFGVTDSGCGTAGITEVDVEIWYGASPVVYETVPCELGIDRVPGALYTLAVGNYTYRLTAYRLVDPVFSGEGNISVAQGVTREARATLGVLTPAPLTLYYTLNGAFTCSGVSSIYYRIGTDASMTNVVANAEIPCDPVAFGFSLPPLTLGNYYVEWFQAIDAGGISRYERCAVAVRHAGFPTIVDLRTSPDSSCPL